MRLLLALFVLLGSARAHAGGEVGLVVTGDGSVQPQLTAQIGDWLQQHEYQLRAAPLPADAVTHLQDCFVLGDKGCERDLVDKRSRVRTLVFAVVDLSKGDGGLRDIALTVYWLEQGRAPLAEKRACTRCTDQMLRASADELMAHLAASAVGDRGHLKVASTPGGAIVAIDGQRAGTAPLQLDLDPGAHVVEVTAPGQPAQTRRVAITTGALAQVDAVFASGGESRPGEGALRYAPYGMIAVGGAAVIAGVVLLAIDEDPSPTGPYMIRDTGAAGVAFLVGGAVVGGAGAYLWYRHSHARSAPVAAVSRDGAVIGWQGRF